MKTILASVMLILTVAVIYMATLGGGGGTLQQVRESGEQMSISISSISP